MTKSTNTRWAVRGSSLALATALAVGGAASASAQSIGPRIDGTRSVQATETVVSGGATVTRTANKDTVTVSTTSTIINWNTLDTNTIDVDPSFVNFLPAGTEMAFESALSDYTVLNRIFSTPNAAGAYRGIAFSGIVSSQVDVGSVGGIGGNVWFYAPGGILVGNGALFNVGSLVLTTSDINAIGAGGSSVNFLGVTDPFSAITIEPAASIVLPRESSYALLAAPTIDNAGVIDVNGSIALASLEEGSAVLGTNGSITDLTVTRQAQFLNRIFNTGLITGPASLQVQDVNGNVITADPHVIEFLAPGVGVNTVLSGSIGYQPALAAAQGDNGQIVITADAGGSLSLEGTQFNSDTAIFATNFNMAAQLGEIVGTTGDARGGYDLFVSAESAFVGAAGGLVTIGGSLVLSAPASGPGALFIDLFGDPVNGVPGGTLDVLGDLILDYSLDEFAAPGAPGNTTGPVNIVLTGGSTLSVGGAMVIDTSVTAGDFGMATSDANGGDVSILTNGTGNTLLIGLGLTIDASAKPFPFTPFDGSDATGGNVLLDLAGATVGAASIAVDASATATGGFFASASGTPDATAGDVTILLGTGNDSILDIGVNASATAGSGADGEAGGNAIGGNVIVAKAGGTLDTQNLVIDTVAFGGVGGSASGFDAPGNSGGSGTGGTITVDTVDMPLLTQLALFAEGLGGDGSTGNDSGAGGTGGFGQGGSVVMNVTGTGVLLQSLADVSAFAGGFGGRGGDGGIPTSAAPGAGGTGGDGQGGVFALSIAGAGASLLVDPFTFPIDVGGSGGSGGDGGDDFSGFPGAAGGDGGAGSAGQLSLTAGSGTNLQLGNGGDSFSANGIGGTGGTGGDSFAGPGAGGNGGLGTGGQVGVLAQGGTVSGGITTFSANGIGGSGGSGGSDGSVGVGAFGNGGNGAGGSVDLATLDGSPGIIQLGDVTVDASGLAGGGTVIGTTTSGQITITDGSVEPNGLISMASLTAFANGETAGFPTSFTLSGGSGPISITGDLSVGVAGDAVFAFDGDGQLIVGGLAAVSAVGDIVVTHSNNATGLETIDSTGPVSLTSGGAMTVGVGAIVNGQDTVFLSAGGDLFVSEVAGVGSVNLSSARNVDLGTAVVSGPPIVNSGSVTSGLFIDAGLITPQPFPLYDPAANATITGDVASSGVIRINAGGSAIFAPGSQTAADNGLLVTTGDDIIVGAGAIVSASGNPVFAPNPLAPFGDESNLTLFAGGLAPLVATTPLTPIASVVVDGVLNAHDFAIELQGNAVDGTAGAFVAGSLRADIVDAPAVGGVQSDDNGLLLAPCLQGSVCLGDLSLTGELAVGLASNNGIIDAYVAGGTFSGSDVAILAGRDIALGSGGADSWVLSGALALDATSGSITIDGLTITATTDGTLTAGGDISYDDLIVTGGGLTLAAGGAVNGAGLQAATTLDISGSTVAIGNAAADTILIASGQDILFDSLVSPNAITLTAATGTIAGNTGAGDIDSGGDVSLDAQTIALGSVIGGNIDLTTNGASSFGAIDSGGILTANVGGDLAIGTFAANSTNLTSVLSVDGNVTFGTMDTTGGIRMIVGGTVTGTLLSADDGVSVDAAQLLGATAADTIVIQDVVSANDLVQLLANNGGIDVGTATAGGAGGVFAVALDGNVAVDRIDTPGSVNLTGNTVTLGSADIGNVFVLTTQTGDATITGPVSAGLAVVDVAANASFADFTTTTGRFELLAGGSFTGGDITAAGLLDIQTGGSATFGDVVSNDRLIFDIGGDLVANSLTVTGSVNPIDDKLNVTVGGDSTVNTVRSDNGRIEFQVGGVFTADTLTALQIIQISAGLNAVAPTVTTINLGSATSQVGVDLFTDFGSIDAGTLTSGTAGSFVSSFANTKVDRIDTTGSVFLRGNSVEFGSADVAGSMFLAALDGDLLVTGPLVTGDNLILESNNGDVTAADATSTGADIRVVARDIVTLENFSAATAIEIDTGPAGGVDARTLAADTVTVNAGTEGVDIAALTAASANIQSTQTSQVDDSRVAGLLTIGGADVTVGSGDSVRVVATATPGSIDISAENELRVFEATAGSFVTLESRSGSIIVELPAATGGQTVSALDGDAMLTAAGDIDIQGGVFASQIAALAAGNLIRVDALVSGQTITGVSSDIEITGGGTLGDATFAEEIRLRTSGTLTFGGDPGSATGYHLDNDELTRVHSGGDIFIVADGSEGAGTGAIVIDTAELVAGLGAAPGDSTFGDSGTLGFLGGTIDVLGELTIESATADTTLAFDTGRARIDTVGGGIYMFDDGGALSGTFNVLADDFYAVTDDALADIQTMTVEEVDARLADSDGVDRPDGVVRVGALDIETKASDVFVQNTALGTSFEERRGIEVGSLRISDPDGTSPQPIVINGIINGQVGIDAVAEAVIDSTFDPASTINGCVINNPASCSFSPIDSQESSIFEGLQDLIEEEIREESEAEEGVADGTFDAPLIEINELDDPSSQPLIDEPVTGAGNEDLWEAPLEDCDPDGSGDEACPA